MPSVISSLNPAACVALYFPAWPYGSAWPSVRLCPCILRYFSVGILAHLVGSECMFATGWVSGCVVITVTIGPSRQFEYAEVNASFQVSSSVVTHG